MHVTRLLFFFGSPLFFNPRFAIFFSIHSKSSSARQHCCKKCMVWTRGRGGEGSRGQGWDRGGGIGRGGGRARHARVLIYFDRFWYFPRDFCDWGNRGRTGWLCCSMATERYFLSRKNNIGGWTQLVFRPSICGFFMLFMRSLGLPCQYRGCTIVKRLLRGAIQLNLVLRIVKRLLIPLRVSQPAVRSSFQDSVLHAILRFVTLLFSKISVSFNRGIVTVRSTLLRTVQVRFRFGLPVWPKRPSLQSPRSYTGHVTSKNLLLELCSNLLRHPEDV